MRVLRRRRQDVEKPPRPRWFGRRRPPALPEGPAEPREPARWLVAGAAVLAAALANMGLADYFGRGAPFLLPMAAVIISSWYGGLGPGLTATALSALSVWFTLFPPAYQFAAPSAVETVRLGAFGLVGAVVSGLSEWRRRLVAALRSSRERLSVALEAAGMGTYAFDADERTCVVDAGLSAILGWPPSPESRPLSAYMEAVHPDDRERVLESLRRRLTGDGPGIQEFRIVRPDGSTRWLREQGRVRQEKDGRTMITGIMSDLSEVRSAEQRSRRAEDLLRLLVERVQDRSIVLLDPEGRVTSWNPAAARMQGFGAEEILGRELDTFCALDDRNCGRRMLDKAAERGQCEEEGWRVRKDGTRFWAEVSVTALRGEDGRLLGFASLTRDLSERKKAEAALEESERRFRALADAIPQMVWIAAPDGEIVWYNRRWYEYTGTTFEQVRGWGWQSLHDPTRLGEVIEKFKASLATGEAFDMTFPLRGADGVFRPFLTRAMPVKDAGGRIVEWFGTNTDVSELKRLERDLQQAKEDLEGKVERRTTVLKAAVADLEAFAHTVAHDLRAPLRSMEGYAQLLLDRLKGKIDAESMDRLERLSSAAVRMDRLIQDVLSYSEITRTPVQPVRVDLDRLMGWIVDNFPGVSRETLTVEGPLGAVLGGEALLTQAVSNLIGNALKFTRPGARPKVRVRAERRPEGRRRLWVEDEGIGIEARHFDRIFKPFERLHPQTSYEGTGIGLTIVKEAVERLGGSFGVESEPGRGSRFWLELPEAP